MGGRVPKISWATQRERKKKIFLAKTYVERTDWYMYVDQMTISLTDKNVVFKTSLLLATLVFGISTFQVFFLYFCLFWYYFLNLFLILFFSICV